MPPADGDSRMWLAEIELHGGVRPTHHLIILHTNGSRHKKHAEEAWQRLYESHQNTYPHIEARLVKLEVWESNEQADRWKADLRSRYPMQAFADEIYPENPNMLLFANPQQSTFGPGEAGEQALIDFLCSGGVNL